MSLLNLLAKKLDGEQLQALQDALGDDFNYDLVPRSRLNAVIKQRDKYKHQLENPDNDDPGDPDNDDPEGNPKEGNNSTKSKATGKSQKEGNLSIDEIIANKDKEKDDAIKALKIEYAAHEKLRNANALDVALVYGLLDTSKITLKEDGTLDGIDDQINTLAKDKAFLFGTDVPNGTGRNNSKSNKQEHTDIDDKIADVFANYGISVNESD